MKGLTRGILNKLPYWLYIQLYYAYCRSAYWPVYERVRHQAGIPPLSEIDLCQYKSHDTLFVLASGPSINNLSTDRWSAIAKADSVGFNFWLYHPFVPTFYFYEGAGQVTLAGAEQTQSEYEEPVRLFLDLAAKRAKEYQNVCKVVMDLVQPSPLRDVFDLPHSFRERLYCAVTLPLLARVDSEFALGLKYLAKKGYFEPQDRISLLFKHTATLSTLVAFGLKLGYKKIVLCGVDLNDEDRFYQDDTYEEARGIDFYRKYRELGPKHVTMRRYGPASTPIDTVLITMKRLLLDAAGIELYVENPLSALAGPIPVAPDSIFSEINGQPQKNARSGYSSR